MKTKLPRLWKVKGLDGFLFRSFFSKNIGIDNIDVEKIDYVEPVFRSLIGSYNVQPIENEPSEGIYYIVTISEYLREHGYYEPSRWIMFGMGDKVLVLPAKRISLKNLKQKLSILI